uniref:Uncharacterized protein n=1 Tax=Arundo donax TaxID=35708 RepID=A0A0A9BMD0_ARUDO
MALGLARSQSDTKHNK